MKLALGTVQFGLDYGLAKLQERVPEVEVNEILKLAKSHKISMLDTAIGYGTSEETLGNIGMDNWDIVTKLPEIPESCEPEHWIRNELNCSLTRLKQPNIYGLLLHKPSQLHGKNGKKITSTLANLKAEGVVKKIGVSIYAPDELSQILDNSEIDIVQAPFNILDRRMIESGWFDRLVKAGIEVHARSIFLQGLLLMSTEDRPEKFKRWNSIWSRFDEWLLAADINRLQACMAFVNTLYGLSKIVVGVNSTSHLAEILEAGNAKIDEFPDWLSSTDPLLINPLGWLKI